MPIPPKMSLLLVPLLAVALCLKGCSTPPEAGWTVLPSVPNNPGARFDPVVRDIEGWQVYIEPALLQGEHAVMGEKSIRMLQNHLERVAVLVPEPALTKLRNVGIWIEVDHPLTDIEPGPYHGGGRWLAANGWDIRMENCVHVTKASSLLERHHMLKHPFVIFHELAHGFHDEQMEGGFNNKLILDAYKNAMANGLYDEVKYYKGQTVKAYATTNQMEYFAELSEAYFYRNDFYPFLNVELKEHDPVGYELMRQVWGGLD
ncbi:MAG: metallopeptidase [Planctomycetota bacterium]